MLISCLSGKFWLFFVSQHLSLTAFLGSELTVTLLGADFSLALQFIVYFLPLSLPHTGCHLGFFWDSLQKVVHFCRASFMKRAVPLACLSFPFPHYKLLVFYGSITVDIHIQGNAKMGRG